MIDGSVVISIFSACSNRNLKSDNAVLLYLNEEVFEI